MILDHRQPFRVHTRHMRAGCRSQDAAKHLSDTADLPEDHGASTNLSGRIPSAGGIVDTRVGTRIVRQPLKGAGDI